MSAFHRFSASVPRSVGLGFGFACGAFVGAALVATGTMTLPKPRFMTNTNRRRPLVTELMSGWLNIPSSSKALDTVRHPYNLLSKLFLRPTKALALPVVTYIPSLSYPPQDALLFRGTNFPTPEPLSLCNLRNIPLPTLPPSPLPIASPRRSLLFHGSVFNSPALIINLSPISPLFGSNLTPDATQLDGQFGHLLGDDDQLDSTLNHQDVFGGLGAKLTTIDGGSSQLMTDLSRDLIADATQLYDRSGHPLGDDDDELYSAPTIRPAKHLVLSRQDVPTDVGGLGATLTIINGGVNETLARALSTLASNAAHKQLRLALLVEFQGDTSSASHTIQGIISNLNEYLQCLAVYMPQDSDDHSRSCPQVEMLQRLVDPTQRSTLQHLVWRGNDISELFLQWRSVSDFPFHRLRTLSLACKLALDDCIQILFQCESLTSFSAWSLAEAESFMKHDFYKKEVPRLQSLTIKSDVLLHKLFETLHMAQLHAIDLQLGPDASSPTQRVHNLTVEWNGLSKVRLGGISSTDCVEVKRLCRTPHLEIHSLVTNRLQPIYQTASA